MVPRQGLYVSYDEDKNGPFDEAVQLSNRVGCVTWFDRFHLNPQQRLQYPTDIFIRLSGKQCGMERYFRGILLAVASVDTVNVNFVEGERNHRPSAWQEQGSENTRSVLYISRLQEVAKPHQIDNLRPPQHPVYVDL